MVDQLPCCGCGKPTFGIMEVDERGGPVVFWAYLCADCKVAMKNDLADVRAAARRLALGGASTATVDRVMHRWFGWARRG